MVKSNTTILHKLETSKVDNNKNVNKDEEKEEKEKMENESLADEMDFNKNDNNGEEKHEKMKDESLIDHVDNNKNDNNDAEKMENKGLGNFMNNKNDNNDAEKKEKMENESLVDFMDSKNDNNDAEKKEKMENESLIDHMNDNKNENYNLEKKEKMGNKSITDKIDNNKNDNEDEKKKENMTNEILESDYYIVGDAVDCIDLKYGAWFEATITKIYRKDDELNYIVKWDLVEYAQPYHVKEQSIRPRAWNVIPESNLKVGQKVMINHNLDEPSEPGHWYDFEIRQISVKRNRLELIGNLFIGNDGELLTDYQITIKDKIYAIEKPKLLKDRTEDDLSHISKIRRIVAPECSNCFDRSDIKCKDCGCKICGGKDNPHQIILCDECEDEYHMDCLRPPLLKVPKNDWYCPKCKNNENEIIKRSKKVRKRSKKLVKKDKSSKDWGKETVKNKHYTVIRKNHRGPIPGIEVGSCWWSRIQVSEAGVHIPPVAGIHGRENDCAYSIVLSGGYGDIDNGNEFIYTGSGGRDLSGNSHIGKQTSHQTLTRANKALALNCKAKFNDKEGATAVDWRAGIPVRVIRNYKLSKYSNYAPSEGNRYDGLYKVVKYYPEYNEDGFRLWRYLLRRDDPLPPPWTPEGKRRIDELGLKIEYPDGYENKSLEKSIKKNNIKYDDNNCKEKQPKKKRKVEPYHLDSNVSEMIDKDVVNAKLWQDCRSYLADGKTTFLNQVSKSFQCVCCQELVFRPVTTPCSHNICQSCLKKSFTASTNSCPTCRFKLKKNLKISVNKELAMVLILLFPGYEGGRK